MAVCRSCCSWSPCQGHHERRPFLSNSPADPFQSHWLADKLVLQPKLRIGIGKNGSGRVKKGWSGQGSVKRGCIRMSAVAGDDKVNTKSVDHVVIAGGGMAGLSLGLALQSRGIPFDIYERREGPGLGRGTLQTLWPNGLRALDAIRPGLAAQMREAGQDMKQLRYTTYEGDEFGRQDYTNLEEKHGFPGLFMHWPRVLEVLEASLPSQNIHYNCTFKSYTETEQGIRATFSDTTSLDGPPEVVAEGSLLVAADGIFSAVRAAAFGGALLMPGDGITSEARAFAFPGSGEAIRDMGRTSWRGLASGLRLIEPGDSTLAQTEGRIRMFVGMKEGTFWFLNVEDKATDNKYRMRSKTKMEIHSRIMQEFGNWPNVAQAVNATDIDYLAEARVLDRPVSADWFEGRVICIGDAVHPLKPAAGQGSNTAFEDSFVLARELARPGNSVQDALSRFQRERKPRLLEIFDYNELLASGKQESRQKAWAKGTDWLWGHQLEDLAVPLQTASV